MIEIPDSASTVAGLRLHLMKRGGAWQEILGDMKVVRVAVNQDMAAANAPLNPGDEVAFLSPGDRRLNEDLGPDRRLRPQHRSHRHLHEHRTGAVASFVGLVREVPMTLEHYPGMTENAIPKIVEEARSRWQILDYA